MNEIDTTISPVEETHPQRRIIMLTMVGIIGVGLCALFLIAFLWFSPDETSLFAKYFPSPTVTPGPTRTPTPNWTATQLAWVKPAESPALASAEELKESLDNGGDFLYVGDMADTGPDLPDIIQPGDIFNYEVELELSMPLLWQYGWCTTTQEILDENFEYIQLEFVINEVSISSEDLFVNDSSDSGSPCREYATLAYRWPKGHHQLETRVTFTQDIDDGWNVYPAGTHIFRYSVTVTGDNPPVVDVTEAEAIKTAISNTAKSWNVLLSDTFDNNKNQWQEGASEDENATTVREVTDGKYRWSVTAQNETIQQVFFDDPAGDFYLSMEFWNSGDTSGDYGVTFREDSNGNFYYFAVSTISEECALLVFNEGEWDALMEWDYCPALDRNEPNNFTLLAEGDEFIILINGQVVGKVQSDLIHGRKIGFGVRLYFGNEANTYEFDNIELKVPEMNDDPSLNNPSDNDTQDNSTSALDDAGMLPLDESDSSGRTLIWVFLGLAAITCGLLFAGAFIYFQPDAQSLMDRYFPSPTATATKTPRPTPTRTVTPTNSPTATVTLTKTPTPTATVPFVLVSPSGDESVLEETFESNKNRWVNYYGNNTASVKIGKLTIRSDEVGYVGAAKCAGCPMFDNAFYFQAEVTTATNTFVSHGLLFCAHPNRVTGYYTFEIDSQNQYYILRKDTDAGWTTLIQLERSTVINKFPRSNTLAVLYNHGKIDLYINGEFVHTYTPADPLECDDIGFIVQEGQIDLIVDNVFAYKIKNIATPTP